MYCSYCGSQDIAYDLGCGYIVCQSCGTILDAPLFLEFYENTLVDKDMNKPADMPLSIKRGLEKKKIRVRKALLTGMEVDIAIYEKYAKRSRKNVYVDLEAAKKREQGVKSKDRIYHHVGEDKALSIVDEDETVRLIISKIIDSDPILSSRTPRGKVALALILKNLLDGKPVDLSEICRKTSMSLVHVRRLLNIAKKRLQKIGSLITALINNPGR